MRPFSYVNAGVISVVVAALASIQGVHCHDGGLLSTITQTIHHLFERPVINIGVQPLSHGHGIKLGVDAVIRTRKHPKKTTHHHHHHYDEEEEVHLEEVHDHHRTGEQKAATRSRGLTFEIGGRQGGGGIRVGALRRSMEAPKITKRKKVPKDYDEEEDVAPKKAYKKKSTEYVKTSPSGSYKSYAKNDGGDPYIRSASAYKKNKVQYDSIEDDEPQAAGSGPIAEYERRGFHSVGSMRDEDDE